jgi:hypothetical protein
MTMRNVMTIKRERRKVRSWTSKQSRRAFEAEAHRQSLLLAAAARDPDSDEAAIMRELDALWDELCRDIEAEEAKARCAISR